jgi:hypothetical protein
MASPPTFRTGKINVDVAMLFKYIVSLRDQQSINQFYSRVTTIRGSKLMRGSKLVMRGSK